MRDTNEKWIKYIKDTQNMGGKGEKRIVVLTDIQSAQKFWKLFV